jgi:predicted O-methyltransferase YrrM
VRRLRRYRRPATFGIAAGILGGLLATLAMLIPFPALAVGITAGIIAATIVATGVRVQDRTLRAVAAVEAQIPTLLPRLDALEAQHRELVSITTMSAMDVPYPLPLGGHWALGWDAAVLLAQQVGSTRPEIVVELGSGASSLVIGLQLRHAGRGHLYTLDHIPGYAATTRGHVVAFGLEPWVTVLDAPLVDQPISDELFSWYRVPDQVKALPRIDLLVVDGPPQSVDRRGSPRYPALPILGDQLGPGSVVFVDDANRAGDRRMLERWNAEDPDWALEIIPTERGTAILRHG